MNSIKFYLDWVPYSTNSGAKEFVVGELNTSKLHQNDQDLVSKISYVCRSDGLLLFKVDWKDDLPRDAGQRIGISSNISRSIKEDVGHLHIFNPSGSKDNHSFPTVSVSPVELDETLTIEIGDTKEEVTLSENMYDRFGSDDSILLNLKFASIKSKARHDRTAIFLIRKQYSQVLLKALKIRSIVRNKKTFLGFKLYDWKLPAIGYGLLIIFALLYRIFQKTEYNKTSDAISITNLQDVMINTFNALCIVLIFFVITVYTLVVSMKRRKILKALHKAKIYLLYADLFNSILSNLEGYKNLNRRSLVGFDRTISIVGEISALEEKKRKQNQTLLIAIGVIAISYLLYIHNLLNDGLVNTLKLLGIALK